MHSVLLTVISRNGVPWQIRLRRVSRDISSTGLALVFVPSSEVGDEKPILWPVRVALMEELFSGTKGTVGARLAEELDAALDSRAARSRQTA